MMNKKINFGLFMCLGLLIFSSKAFAQTPASPPPGGPPPPPPSPTEVFNKINPFKKKGKTDTSKAKSKANAPAAVETAPPPPAGGPPPPPNPLNLFKKKKKDTIRKTAPVPPRP
jgi:hypothetical protein